MKHRIASILFVALLISPATVLPQSRVQELIVKGGCNYDGEPFDSKVYTFESDAAAVAAVDKILDPLGLVRNFEVRAADVSNAAAVIHGETRYLLYNQAFIRRVKEVTRTDWAAVSIMAHEIGHHLNGHTLLPGGSRPPTELEADSFSGFVLYKMGATLEQAEAAMNAISSEKGSATHPPRRSRIAAIEAGWTKAQDREKTSSAPVPTAPQTTPDKTDSSKLVGIWEGENTESGYTTQVTWQVNADGTNYMWFSSAFGTSARRGHWRYSNGVLDQGTASATVTWIDNNHIVLTIIQNEDGPSSRGRTRHYYRRTR